MENVIKELAFVVKYTNNDYQNSRYFREYIDKVADDLKELI